jgi:hypothetical protein
MHALTNLADAHERAHARTQAHTQAEAKRLSKELRVEQDRVLTLQADRSQRIATADADLSERKATYTTKEILKRDLAYLRASHATLQDKHDTSTTRNGTRYEELDRELHHLYTVTEEKQLQLTNSASTIEELTRELRSTKAKEATVRQEVGKLSALRTSDAQLLGEMRVELESLRKLDGENKESALREAEKQAKTHGRITRIIIELTAIKQANTQLISELAVAKQEMRLVEAVSEGRSDTKVRAATLQLQEVRHTAALEKQEGLLEHERALSEERRRGEAILAEEHGRCEVSTNAGAGTAKRLGEEQMEHTATSKRLREVELRLAAVKADLAECKRQLGVARNQECKLVVQLRRYRPNFKPS